MSLSKTFSTKAIVIKTFNIGEADKIITMFSHEYGLIRSIAKGVRKAKSNLSGYFDLLNVNTLLLKKNRNLNSIEQCETYMTFPELRLDYDKLVYSLYLGELVMMMSNDEEPCDMTFNLLIKSLKYLESSESPLINTIWFELKMLIIKGYEPDLYNCEMCQESLDTKSLENIFGYILYTGNIVCNECRKLSKNYKIFDSETINFLRLLLNTEKFETVNEISFKTEKMEAIHNSLKVYLSSLSERKIKTLSVLV